MASRAVFRLGRLKPTEKRGDGRHICFQGRERDFRIGVETVEDPRVQNFRWAGIDDYSQRNKTRDQFNSGNGFDLPTPDLWRRVGILWSSCWEFGESRRRRRARRVFFRSWPEKGKHCCG